MSKETTTDQFFELVQRFIHLRPKMVVPEHIARFKKQMQNLKLGGATNQEDRSFIFRIFIILERNETSPTMGELSTELGIPLSSATRIVDGLVGAKFIERVPDANDRRVVRVQMTAAGREIYQSAREFNKQRISHMLSKFSPEEQSQLLFLMNKLFDSLIAEAEIEKGVNQ
jgi:DNA-binding MarR family transcriptional regulator